MTKKKPMTEQEQEEQKINYDHAILVSELRKQRKSHKKNKDNKYLMQVGIVEGDPDEEISVFDIGLTNLFLADQIDTLCARSAYSKHMFEITDYEVIYKHINIYGEEKEKREIIHSPYTYTRGHYINRKHNTIGYPMEKIKRLAWWDILDDYDKDFWKNITNSFLPTGANLENMSHSHDYHKWEIYLVDGIVAVYNESEDGNKTIKIYDLVEKGLISKKDVKEKDDAIRADKALAVAQNFGLNMLDKSSFIDMLEIDGIFTKELWREILELNVDNINLTHMAKEINVHKNTLYRLQKKDMEKFNMYFRAYKCMLMENVIKTENHSWV